MGKYSFETSDLLEAYLNLPEEEFIIVVTHDIRHCCTAILAFGELIQMGIDSGDAGTPGLVENYVSIVPLRIADMTNVLDAAVEYDRIQKSKHNRPSSNAPSSDSVGEAIPLDFWLREPECFIPTLTAYVRDRQPGILSKIEAIRQNMQDDSAARSENFAIYLSDLLVIARDIVNITTVAVEYDESQNGKHYS